MVQCTGNAGKPVPPSGSYEPMRGRYYYALPTTTTYTVAQVCKQLQIGLWLM